VARFLDSAAAFLASFSPAERAVARHAFRGVLAGRPVAVGDVAPALALPAAEVEAAVARHLARGTMVVQGDRVVAARGLSIPPTPHALDVGGRRLHGFCAIDVVGIPIALGLDAAVRSRCHHCATAVALTIARGAVREAPADLIIWAPDRDPERSLRAHT
jgi:hypothetical protein